MSRRSLFKGAAEVTAATGTSGTTTTVVAPGLAASAYSKTYMAFGFRSDASLTATFTPGSNLTEIGDLALSNGGTVRIGLETAIGDITDGLSRTATTSAAHFASVSPVFLTSSASSTAPSGSPTAAATPARSTTRVRSITEDNR